jgi:drug/metabolite transporter (DMT)-like permease
MFTANISTQQRLRVVALAIAFCLLWISAFIAGKFGLRSAPPLLFLSVRFALAASVTLIIASVLRHRFPRTGREWFVIAVLGLLNNTLYLGLSFFGLKSVSAGLVTIIASTNPLLTAVLAYWVLDEGLGLRKLVGLGLGVAGVTLIMRHRIAAGMDDGMGVMLVVLGTAAMAAATVLFKKERSQVSLLVVNALQLLFGSLGLLPVALCLEDPGAIHVDMRFILAQAHLVLAVSLLAMIIWFRLLEKTTASNASALHFINPAIGMFLGWLLLGEHISPSDFVGIIPVAFGIALVTRPATTR